MVTPRHPVGTCSAHNLHTLESSEAMGAARLIRTQQPQHIYTHMRVRADGCLHIRGQLPLGLAEVAEHSQLALLTSGFVGGSRIDITDRTERWLRVANAEVTLCLFWGYPEITLMYPTNKTQNGRQKVRSGVVLVANTYAQKEKLKKIFEIVSTPHRQRY